MIDTVYLDDVSGAGISILDVTSSDGEIFVERTVSGTDTLVRIGLALASPMAKDSEVSITEEVRFSACSGSESTLFKVWYPAGGEECSAVSNTATAGANVNTSLYPSITMGHGNGIVLGCPGEELSQQFIIVNNGTDTAHGISFFVYNAYNSNGGGFL